MMNPGIRLGETPPFCAIDEYVFQELCRDLLAAEPGIATCSIYGRRGQGQYGIDLRAPRRHGTGIDLGQCKRYERFPPRKIRAASDEFLAHWAGRWAREKVKRFILFVACELNGREQQDEIANQEKRFRELGIDYEAWPADTIRNKLRPHPSIVKTYLADPEYWAGVICGESPSASPQLDVQPSRVVSAVLVDELEQLGSILSTETEQRLELMRTAWRQGRRDEAIKGVNALKSEAPRWRVLAPNIKAKILRFEASLELETTGNVSRAAELAEEARAMAPLDNDTRLRALITYWTSGPAVAIPFLAGQQDIDSLNLRAALLVELGRTEECRSVLESTLQQAIEASAETHRIWSLLSLLTRDLSQARLEIERAQQLQPGWESIEFTAAVIDYFSALSPADLPDRLAPWPAPVEWTVVKGDDESRARLRKAAGAFKELAERPGRQKDERQTLESWHLACLSNDPERQEEAAEYCSALLRIDPTNYRAIPWALARDFKANLQPSKKALRKAIANQTADIPQIIALVSCYLASHEAKKAADLLAKTKPKFVERTADSIWSLWYAQSLVAAGATDAALAEINRSEPTHELRHVKTIVLWALAKKNGDWSELTRHLERSYEETRDPIFLLRACEVKAQHREWTYVAERAVRLVEGLETAESVRLAAIACYNVDRFELCVQLLDQHLNLFGGQKLSLELRRIRILCQQALSLLPEAIREAELLAREEPTTDNLRTLAKLYVSEGDLKGLTLVARQLVQQPDLSAEQALEICQWVKMEDSDLARSIWRRANGDTIPDSAIGLAVTLAYQLGLDEEVRPLLHRMTHLGEAEQGGIRLAGVQDIVSFLRERSREAQELEEKYRRGEIPIHFLAERMRLPLARLYHTVLDENERDPEPSRQFALLARHGSRPLVAGLPDGTRRWRLHLDITAILLADHLGILSEVEQEFKPLRIPPDVVPTLLQMRDNLMSQQPSQLRAYQEIVSLVDRGLLLVGEWDVPAGYENSKLIEELSERWVASFESARSNAGHLVDFLPLKKRDLGGPPTALPDDSNQYLANCRAVADALWQQGPLSQDEHERALERMGTLGQEASGETIPAQGTPLYCHATIPIVLSNANLLRTACERFQVWIEKYELERVRAELQEFEKREDLDEWLGQLIDRLSAGIASGIYELIPAPIEKEGTKERIPPEEAAVRCLMTLLSFQPQEGDVIWVDDRHVNAFLYREGGSPVVGVNEVLKALVAYSALETGVYYDKLNRLRAANVRFIPIQAEEIVYHLAQARVENGVLIETRDLRTIRRYSASCILWYKTGEAWLPGAGNPNRDERQFLLSLRRATAAALISLWENDEERGIIRAKADWILSNLYLDRLGLVSAASLPRPPQDDQYLVAASLAELIIQAFGLKWDSPNKPAPRREYLDWLLDRTLHFKFDLDKRLLVTVTEILKESLAETMLVILKKGNKRTVQRLLQFFYEDLPGPIKDEIGMDTSFMESIGLRHAMTVSVGEFVFEASDFYAAARMAVNGATARIAPVGRSSDVILEPAAPAGSCSFMLGDPTAERKHHVADDVFCLLHDSVSVREEALRGNRQWFDSSREEHERVIAEIVTMEDAQRRVEVTRSWMERSAEIHYRRLESQLRPLKPFRLSDLRPPGADALLGHFRLSPDVGFGGAFSKALDAAADALIREDGLTTAIGRLTRFPIRLPQRLVEEIGQLREEDRHGLLEQLLEGAVSPLSRIHAIYLISQFASDARDYVQRARERITGSFDRDGTERFRAFLAVLRWTDEDFSRWADARAWSPHLRLAMTWAHAEKLFATFVSTGVSVPWIREEFEQSTLLAPVETFHRNPDYKVDIAHPRRLEKISFLLCGFAYAIGKDTAQIVDDDLREFLGGQAFIEFDGGRLPGLELLMDSTRAGNSVNSFLGGDRKETLAPLLSQSDMASISAPEIRMLAHNATEEIISARGQTAAWVKLWASIGDLPPDASLADRLKAALQATDFPGLFEHPSDASYWALLTASAQVGHLNDDDLRGRLKDDLVAIARILAQHGPRTLNETSGGTPDITKSAELLLESELNLSLAPSVGSEHPATEFAELVTGIVDAWPSVGAIYRPFLQRLSEDLPIEDVSELWPLLIRLRAEE